jgi:hypothetical protein
MPLVKFRLAVNGNARDDADLRRLLCVNALPGDIHLSYEREPSFWAAAGIEGPLHQTMIVRTQDGRAVGMGSRSVRMLYVNGEAASVGYMSQMRVDPTFPWGVALPKVLAQGWRFFRQLHRDGLTPYYLVSLVAGDSVGFRMMTLGLPGWPALHAAGGLLTFGLYVRRARAVPRLASGMKLRRATEDDRAAIHECLTRNLRRRQFAPVWEASALGDPVWTPDLSLADFWVVERASQVVGTLARWNQQRFKQTVARGYDEPWAQTRPYINLIARLGFAPHLPAIGEAVRHSFASHLAVDDDDPQVAAALLAAVYNSAVQAGDGYLMVGLDSEHPLTKLMRSYRREVNATQLFLATWGDEAALARRVEGGQMGAEIALL